MKQTSLKMRILSLILVLCMSFAMMSVAAFAAEDPNPGANTGDPNEPDRAVGDVLYAGSASFTNSVTITLNMGQGNWSADFLVIVMGNAGARYMVELTTPSGSTHTAYVTSGTGVFTNMATLVYASAGTYTFTFTRISGNAGIANAIAEICD